MKSKRPRGDAQTSTSDARLRDLVEVLARHRKVIIFGISLSLIAGLAMLAQPTIVNEIIQRVQNSEPLEALPWLLIASLVISAALTSAREYVLLRAGESIVLGARVSLVRRILLLPIAQYDRRRMGDLVSRVGADTAEIRNVLTNGLVDAIGGSVVLIGSLVAMFIIDMQMFAYAAAIALVALGGVVLISSRTRVISRKAQASVGVMTSRLSRALGAIRTIRATNAAESETRAIEQDARSAWKSGLAIAKNEALIAPVSMITGQLSLLLILGAGGLRVSTGSMSIASLITFMLFLVMMMSPLGSIFTAFSSINRSLGAITRMREIEQLPIEEDGSELASTSPATLVSTHGLSVEFDRVTFQYDHGPTEGKRETRPSGDGPSATVKDITFRVAAGTRTAIVGRSGAGKSTLFALLERFYDLDSGTIRIAGHDITELTRTQVRGLIGYVEQKAPILVGTVRDNLLLGAPGATDEECTAALLEVNLQAFAGSGGLDMEVGEGGSMLSGGEGQRLAIARVLLAGHPILLLDESTSNLDADNEAMLTTALDRVNKNRTVLVIAHRLSTVYEADQIVVLDEGEVIGVGDHTTLLRSTPLYANLAARQLVKTE